MYGYDDDSFQEMREEAHHYITTKNRSLIEAWCKEAHVITPVGYDNQLGKRKLIIYTDRPGYLIGKGGLLVNKYIDLFSAEFSPSNPKKYSIEFVEVQGGFANYREMENSITVEAKEESDEST